jgi:outer membrane protein OmpA-like peptidoglycan-associated protein
MPSTSSAQRLRPQLLTARPCTQVAPATINPTWISSNVFTFRGVSTAETSQLEVQVRDRDQESNDPRMGLVIIPLSSIGANPVLEAYPVQPTGMPDDAHLSTVRDLGSLTLTCHLGHPAPAAYSGPPPPATTTRKASTPTPTTPKKTTAAPSAPATTQSPRSASLTLEPSTPSLPEGVPVRKKSEGLDGMWVPEAQAGLCFAIQRNIGTCTSAEPAAYAQAGQEVLRITTWNAAAGNKGEYGELKGELLVWDDRKKSSSWKSIQGSLETKTRLRIRQGEVTKYWTKYNQGCYWTKSNQGQPWTMVKQMIPEPIFGDWLLENASQQDDLIGTAESFTLKCETLYHDYLPDGCGHMPRFAANSDEILEEKDGHWDAYVTAICDEFQKKAWDHMSITLEGHADTDRIELREEGSLDEDLVDLTKRRAAAVEAALTAKMKDVLKSLPKFECTGCGLQKKGFDPVAKKTLGPSQDRRVYILAHASRTESSQIAAEEAYGFTIGMTACEAMDAELCVKSQNYTACQGLCFLSDDPSTYKRHAGILRIDDINPACIPFPGPSGEQKNWLFKGWHKKGKDWIQVIGRFKGEDKLELEEVLVAPAHPLDGVWTLHERGQHLGKDEFSIEIKVTADGAGVEGTCVSDSEQYAAGATVFTVDGTRSAHKLELHKHAVHFKGVARMSRDTHTERVAIGVLDLAPGEVDAGKLTLRVGEVIWAMEKRPSSEKRGRSWVFSKLKPIPDLFDGIWNYEWKPPDIDWSIDYYLKDLKFAPNSSKLDDPSIYGDSEYENSEDLLTQLAKLLQQQDAEAKKFDRHVYFTIDGHADARDVVMDGAGTRLTDVDDMRKLGAERAEAVQKFLQSLLTTVDFNMKTHTSGFSEYSSRFSMQPVAYVPHTPEKPTSQSSHNRRVYITATFEDYGSTGNGSIYGFEIKHTSRLYDDFDCEWKTPFRLCDEKLHCEWTRRLKVASGEWRVASPLNGVGKIVAAPSVKVSGIHGDKYKTGQPILWVETVNEDAKEFTGRQLYCDGRQRKVRGKLVSEFELEMTAEEDAGEDSDARLIDGKWHAFDGHLGIDPSIDGHWDFEFGQPGKDKNIAFCTKSRNHQVREGDQVLRLVPNHKGADESTYTFTDCSGTFASSALSVPCVRSGAEMTEVQGKLQRLDGDLVLELRQGEVVWRMKKEKRLTTSTTWVMKKGYGAEEFEGVWIEANIKDKYIKEKIQEDIVKIQDQIGFDHNSDVLTEDPGTIATIQELAVLFYKYMRHYRARPQSAHFTIYGNADLDDVGYRDSDAVRNDEYLTDLSRRRAESVRDRLLVESNKLLPKGHTQPFTANDIHAMEGLGVTGIHPVTKAKVPAGHNRKVYIKAWASADEVDEGTTQHSQYGFAVGPVCDGEIGCNGQETAPFSEGRFFTTSNTLEYAPWESGDVVLRIDTVSYDSTTGQKSFIGYFADVTEGPVMPQPAAAANARTRILSEVEKAVEAELEAILQRHSMKPDFEGGKWDLGEDDAPALDELAAVAQRHPGLFFRIDVHADTDARPEPREADGTPRLMELCLNRAQAVKDALVERGVAADHVDTKGSGAVGVHPLTGATVDPGLNKRVYVSTILEAEALGPGWKKVQGTLVPSMWSTAWSDLDSTEQAEWMELGFGEAAWAEQSAQQGGIPDLLIEVIEEPKEAATSRQKKLDGVWHNVILKDAGLHNKATATLKFDDEITITTAGNGTGQGDSNGDVTVGGTKYLAKKGGGKVLDIETIVVTPKVGLGGTTQYEISFTGTFIFHEEGDGITIKTKDGETHAHLQSEAVRLLKSGRIPTTGTLTETEDGRPMLKLVAGEVMLEMVMKNSAAPTSWRMSKRQPLPCYFDGIWRHDNSKVLEAREVARENLRQECIIEINALLNDDTTDFIANCAELDLTSLKVLETAGDLDGQQITTLDKLVDVVKVYGDKSVYGRQLYFKIQGFADTGVRGVEQTDPFLLELGLERSITVRNTLLEKFRRKYESTIDIESRLTLNKASTAEHDPRDGTPLPAGFNRRVYVQPYFPPLDIVGQPSYQYEIKCTSMFCSGDVATARALDLRAFARCVVGDDFSGDATYGPVMPQPAAGPVMPQPAAAVCVPEKMVAQPPPISNVKHQSDGRCYYDRNPLPPIYPDTGKFPFMMIVQEVTGDSFKGMQYQGGKWIKIKATLLKGSSASPRLLVTPVTPEEGQVWAPVPEPQPQPEPEPELELEPEPEC